MRTSIVVMSTFFYHMLGKAFKPKGSHTVNTHRGVAPTLGSWLFPNYALDDRVREQVYRKLVFLQESGIPFAPMENIDYLAQDALTRVRVDLDVNLPTEDPSAFQPHLSSFIETLYNVLYEHTALTPEDELAGTVILLEKPHCTARDDGVSFKHGAKLTLPYLLATHTDMLQLRILLLQRADSWMPASWHGDIPPLDTSIIDPLVYRSCGWLMYGSQKQKQVHGGYKATRVWHRKDDVEAVADCDWSLLDLQRMLSIFCALEADDDVQVLKWLKNPPALEQHTVRKVPKFNAAGAKQHSRRVTASVLSVLQNVLAELGDTTSLLTHDLTEEDLYRYRVTWNEDAMRQPARARKQHKYPAADDYIWTPCDKVHLLFKQVGSWTQACSFAADGACKRLG